jgi:hypothetical protein
MYTLASVGDLTPDETNPRKPDEARLHLLRLSLTKLGFVLPVSVTSDGLILSGHQRVTVSKELGFAEIPVDIVDLPEKDVRGMNIMYNRCTNDFGALDTGSESFKNLSMEGLIEEAEKLPDMNPAEWPLMFAKEQSITGLVKTVADKYDKKAVVAAENFVRKKIRIPIVVSESGQVINGVYRLFAAREAGVKRWPVVTIPDELGAFAVHFLNYLSMDFDIGEDFRQLLRYSAYRRPQNNRGDLPKAYRFWANGHRTLPDKDSYSRTYWRVFRDMHGHNLLDFGAGLCKVAPLLNSKGFNCVDFEPYRIDHGGESMKPSPMFSKQKAREFLQTIADPDLKFDSVFLASVMNSVPFPQDRMAVLLIVHALSAYDTGIYGTCRDESDFHYEYQGIRQANYFVLGTEPGIRLGDAVSNPKIQKFHTTEEMDSQLKMLWTKTDFWKGGNVFYWTAARPKRINPKSLAKALEFEFNLPYADGTTMDLVGLAKECFSKRLGVKIP